MARIDFKKELKRLYGARAGRIDEIDVPALRFLMIDGAGEPDPETNASYGEALEALFSVSYTAKFAVKKDTSVDYGVMPLEGLWWAEDMSAFARGDKRAWQWTMMIMQPDPATDAVIEAAIAAVRRRKDLPGIARLRLETFREGKAAQTLHVGPFADEGPTIEQLHAHIGSRSALRGKHHEIYLSDIRRAAPSRWRTIIRQPMS